MHFLRLGLYFIFIVFASGSIALAAEGVLRQTNEIERKFFDHQIESIYSYDTHIAVKKFDNIKKIIFLDPGKKYDGTKSGIGDIEFVRRDGKRITFTRCQIASENRSGYIRFKIRNPVTEEIEYIRVPTDEISIITFD